MLTWIHHSDQHQWKMKIKNYGTFVIKQAVNFNSQTWIEQMDLIWPSQPTGSAAAHLVSGDQR